ncbi:MdtA/MuxA family multidrug efflux RND transporter periplasmic adaptor subunit [Solidesulfovibrio sp.]
MQTTTSGSARRGPFGWLALAGLLLAGAGIFWWHSAGNGQAQPGGPGGPGMGGQVVSVTTAVARAGVAPVTLSGLGTVTPLRTVTVKSRVDGELMDVRFTEGQLVKEGELLAQIDPRAFAAQLEQYQGQLAKDTALLENARADLTRYSSLAKKDMLAGQTKDTQGSLVRQYEGAIRTDKGLIDNARLQLEYSRITAPITGRVGLRKVDAGNMVKASESTAICVITQVSPISVLFTLPEDQLPAVLARHRAGERLTVAAYDRSMTRKLAGGILATADNQIDTATGTVKLRAVFDNADEALFPNQFVNAELLLEERKGVILVPAAAVQRGPKGARVYVVDAGGVARSKAVTAGLAVGEDVVADSGLTAGEVVVVEGADRLRDGARVAVRDSGPAVAGKP